MVQWKVTAPTAPTAWVELPALPADSGRLAFSPFMINADSVVYQGGRSITSFVLVDNLFRAAPTRARLSTPIFKNAGTSYGVGSECLNVKN
jgi:hypothetical protein